MMRRAGLLVVALGATALLSACSSTPPSATSQLQRDVSALTAAAAAHDLPRARAALNTLTADLRAAHVAGDITRARYDQIVANISAVGRDLEIAGPATGTPRTTTNAAVHTTAAPASQAPSVRNTPPKPPGKSKTHGHGHGDGNGNGNGDG